MALFKVYRGLSSSLPEGLHDGYAYFTTDDGKFYIDTATKRTLINPDCQASDMVVSKTTAQWDADTTTIGQVNHIYVYTDYQTDGQGNPIPGIKIGTGNGYVVDLPFIDTVMMDHINNGDVHVTTADKAYWNQHNWFDAYYSASTANLLVLTKDSETRRV